MLYLNFRFFTIMLSDLPQNLHNGEHREECSYTKKADTSYLRIMREKAKAPLQNLVSRNKEYVVERYKHIKHGGNWQDIPSELMQNYSNTKNMHSGIYKRLDPSQPSVVIANYRKSMLIHPYENRGLSLREAARLQSFPDDFIFQGTLSFQQQQVGNAVPPLLARAVAEQVKIAISKNKSSLSFIPDRFTVLRIQITLQKVRTVCGTAALEFDGICGKVFLDHKSDLEGDSILKDTKVKTGTLLQLVQTVNQGISVDIQLSGSFGYI